MMAMSILAALLLTGSAPAAAAVTAPPQAGAVATARARILSPAEVRRVNGRLDVRTGDGKAPAQVHRTERHDGGQTADFY